MTRHVDRRSAVECPPRERVERDEHLAAERGQLVVDARRDRRRDMPGDQPVSLEAAQILPNAVVRELPDLDRDIFDIAPEILAHETRSFLD